MKIFFALMVNLMQTKPPKQPINKKYKDRLILILKSLMPYLPTKLIQNYVSVIAISDPAEMKTWLIIFDLKQYFQNICNNFKCFLFVWYHSQNVPCKCPLSCLMWLLRQQIFLQSFVQHMTIDLFLLLSSPKP